jgi:hypothetical protein
MLELKYSFLNWVYVLINALKALVTIVFMCSIHVIFLSNITPEIFYIICKRRVLSMRSNSKRKVDRLRLVFIDLNVPALGSPRH